jgi:hypothetical protein
MGCPGQLSSSPPEILQSLLSIEFDRQINVSQSLRETGASRDRGVLQSIATILD